MYLSSNLSDDRLFSSSDEAIHHCLGKLVKASPYFVSDSFAIEIINDVRCIIEGPSRAKATLYVMVGLSQVKRLLSSARKAMKNAKKVNSPNCASKGVLFRCVKKLDFLMAWSQDVGKTYLASAAVEIEMLHKNLANDTARLKFECEAIANVKPHLNAGKDKVLIQELS